MPFPRDLLNDHEELVLDLRPHWLYLVRPSAALAGALIVGIVVLASGLDGGFGQAVQWLVALGVLAALLWFAKVYLQWTTTMFVLTTDRIITRRGLLTKSGTEIPLERVNTVFFHQRILERMVGAGDLTIESAGERGTETFSDIRRPSVVQKEIYVQMEENENRKYDRINRGRDAPLAPSPPAADPTITQVAGAPPPQSHLAVPEQLDRLAELHARGVITDEEFARKKAELLDRM